MDQTTASSEPSDLDRDQRLALLLRRLPRRVQEAVAWLLRPSSRWVRIPAAILLILGSFLFILPFFGLWMLPLGLVLLAEDVGPLRRLTDRWLVWIERRHPGWMGLPAHAGATPERKPPDIGTGDAGR